MKIADTDSYGRRSPIFIRLSKWFFNCVQRKTLNIAVMTGDRLMISFCVQTRGVFIGKSTVIGPSFA